MTGVIKEKEDWEVRNVEYKKIPQRQCIGCGEMKNKKEMLRVLKTTDDQIIIDATGRKNGRGAYICPSKDCYKKAVKNKRTGAFSENGHSKGSI